MVKSAAVGDPGLFELIERPSPTGVLGRDLALVEEIALRAVAVKAAIVARDERESGDRALLNLGHTVGHALEAEGGFSRLTHGEAVALGMVAALRVGEALGATTRGARPARDGAPRAARAPDRPRRAAGAAGAAVRGARQGSGRAGAIRFVLLHDLGDARVHPLAPALLPGLLAGRRGAPSL